MYFRPGSHSAHLIYRFPESRVELRGGARGWQLRRRTEGRGIRHGEDAFSNFLGKDKFGAAKAACAWEHVRFSSRVYARSAHFAGARQM